MEQMNMEQVQTQAITAEEVSQRIQEAIEQARAEWERAQAENQRMAAMSSEERAGYEMSRREAELNEREKKLIRREVKAMALEKLTERGLPCELADALNCDSEAECLKGIDRIERAFRQAVQAAVDERLRGESPTVGSARRMDADSMSDAEYYQTHLRM